MKRIVITGGPCSGKTSCLTILAKQLKDQVVIVPEVATILLQGGFPLPPRPVPCSAAGWSETVQSAILNLQRHLEEASQYWAQHHGKQLLVCDRGQLDGAAYWPDGIEAYIERFKICTRTIYAHYVAVIHLESLATALPHLYGTIGNQHRYESLAEAQACEYATRSAWEQHPNRVFIPGNQPLAVKVEQILTIVRSHFAP